MFNTVKGRSFNLNYDTCIYIVLRMKTCGKITNLFIFH